MILQAGGTVVDGKSVPLGGPDRQQGEGRPSDRR
jgi:hypothetical protein